MVVVLFAICLCLWVRVRFGLGSVDIYRKGCLAGLVLSSIHLFCCFLSIPVLVVWSVFISSAHRCVAERTASVLCCCSVAVVPHTYTCILVLGLCCQHMHSRCCAAAVVAGIAHLLKVSSSVCRCSVAMVLFFCGYVTPQQWGHACSQPIQNLFSVCSLCWDCLQGVACEGNRGGV